MSKPNDYQVGYRKPPQHTRFKKGQSGNPRGRPKGSKNLGSLIQQELQKSIVIKEGNTERKLTKLEAIALRLTNDALKGNPKTIDLLLKRLDKLQIPDPFEITSEDDAIFEDGMKRLAQRNLDDGKA